MLSYFHIYSHIKILFKFILFLGEGYRLDLYSDLLQEKYYYLEFINSPEVRQQSKLFSLFQNLEFSAKLIEHWNSSANHPENPAKLVQAINAKLSASTTPENAKQAIAEVLFDNKDELNTLTILSKSHEAIDFSKEGKNFQNQK